MNMHVGCRRRHHHHHHHHRYCCRRNSAAWLEPSSVVVAWLFIILASVAGPHQSFRCLSSVVAAAIQPTVTTTTTRGEMLRRCKSFHPFQTICAESTMNTRRRRLGIYSALHFSRRSSTSSKVDDETSLVSRQQETIQSGKVKVLSQDPLVYIIPNLLSKEECLEYQQYVKNLQQDNDADVQRPMTKSNPPAVSLDLSKLWPLPFLSLAAGIPPVVRLFVDTNNNGETSSSHSSIVSSISINEILSAALPNIAIALTVSGFLAFGLVLPLLRWYSASYSRTSYAMALNQPATKGAQRGDFEMIRPLVHRVSALTRHSWEKWEAPVVTRYDVGAIFARHGDASPTKGSEWQDLGGQRVVTCICYLNTLAADDSSGTGGGGETYFEKLNLAVSPKAGDGLVFFPSNSITWEADDRTTHESLPPTSQEKWIVQLFGRAQRVPPPLGLDDSYGNIL